MLETARQHAIEVLKIPRRAVIVTSGPAGIQAGEFACEAVGLALYLLIPQTSDHLFNLEHDPGVTLLASGWELRGQAKVVREGMSEPGLGLLSAPGAEWCALVRVEPVRLQIHGEGGWGNRETIDLGVG